MFAETEEEARARRSQQIAAAFQQKRIVGKKEQEQKESGFLKAFVVAIVGVALIVLIAVVIEDQIASQTRTPALSVSLEARHIAERAVRRLPPRPRSPPAPSPPPSRPFAPPSPSSPPSPHPPQPSSPPLPSSPPPSPSPSPPPRQPGEAALRLRTCSILIHGLRISLLDNLRCEDGGTGSVSALCTLGTDYGDCDPR
mgnify:CR=1 FL=1